MAEVAESRQANPLSSDYELFQMYMHALDAVLGARDVRRSFDEFGLSAGILRIKMVHDARRVLRTAVREFTAYESAVASELSARAVALTMAPQKSHWSRAGWLQELTGRLVSTDLGEGLLGGALALDFGPEVEAARDRLMAVITETELLAQVRTFINTARQSRFGHVYSVVSSPALSEVYDKANRIPTQIESELAGLLDRLDGASIGVAGPRGAGKSTLIREFCDEVDSSTDELNVIGWSSLLGGGLLERSWGNLRCMVTAPVDYVARDFALHLFATFCGAVISGYSKAGRFRGVLLAAFWVRRIAQLKGIFGIPHLYFMVAVSDDALNAFERRGLPLRDAFDSSFDEILRVEPLTYYESRRLLYRRVIGLTEPYVALCHCLAGGLARDVIRAARQVARNAANLISTGPFLTAASGVQAGDEASAAYELRYVEASNGVPDLSRISAAVLYDELRRKLRALIQVAGHLDSEDATGLQDTLHDIALHLAPDKPISNIVDLIAKPGHAEPPAVAQVRLDLAAYAYYCATLQEIFTDRLDDAHMVKATSKSSGPGSFDALASARNAFTIDTLLAWNLVTRCRNAWSLETRNSPKANILWTA